MLSGAVGAGSAPLKPLKSLQGGVVIPTMQHAHFFGSQLALSFCFCFFFSNIPLKVFLMILSSKKLPELWDYFLIYISGALEFNPDCKDIDLGLFPLRMNPTIKSR